MADGSAQLGRLRVVVTDETPEPTAAEWAAGEDVADLAAGALRARELAGLAIAAGEFVFVWLGFDGLTAGGSSHAERRFRVLVRMPPPGWPDPERERQEANVRAWEAHKEAQAEAAKLAKAAAAIARKAAYTPNRDTSLDAIR